jgi:hypothetical protein
MQRQSSRMTAVLSWLADFTILATLSTLNSSTNSTGKMKVNFLER